jgi:hypothetical protein
MLGCQTLGKVNTGHFKLKDIVQLPLYKYFMSIVLTGLVEHTT